MKNQLGSYLYTLRKQNNYTQAYVAQQIGIGRQNYSHYETGRVRPPVKILCQLAELYGIPMEILLGAVNEIKDKELQKDNMELYQLSKAEQELIRFHRLLNEQEQEEIMDAIKLLAKKRNGKGYT